MSVQQEHSKPSWDSSSYRKHRPTYPPALFQAVLQRHGDAPRDVAVDVGTGNGQVAFDLAQHFKQVIGVDASTSQLEHAKQAPNLSFRQATAEDTGLPSSSVDLVTTAAALHWFDVPAFYREARRILKPSGTLAAFTYCDFTLNRPEAEAVRQRYYEQHWKAFMHPKLWLVLNDRYQGLEPAASDFGSVERLELPFEYETDIAGVVGWQLSTSGHVAFVQAHGQAAADELLQQYRQDLVAACGGDAGARLLWQVRLVLIVARQPQPL